GSSCAGSSGRSRSSATQLPSSRGPCHKLRHSSRLSANVSTTYRLPQDPGNSAVLSLGGREAVLTPAPVDQVTNLLAHLDALGPLAGALGFPLVGRVDADLASVAVHRRCVVELVGRPLRDDEVA